MGKALKVVVLTLVMLATLLSGSPMRASVAAADPTSWTVMVYMAGNASPELPLLQNLNEMEGAAQNQWVNIIALADPFGGGNSTLYKIEHDPAGMNTAIVSTVLDDGGAVIPNATHNADMGSPTTLSSFVEFAAESYPADRYVLVLWGHGADWYGLCPDGTDILTLPELRAALAQATEVLGRPLDIVAADACSEASLEMFFEVRGYVKYFVASEKDVPLQGLPYVEILDDLSGDVNRTSLDFAESIADDYVDWSRNNSAHSATMSVFNLSAMAPFVPEFATWVGMGIRFEGLFHSELRTAFNSSETYETPWQNDFGGILSHVQAADVPPELQQKSADVLRAYNSFRMYVRTFDNPDAMDDRAIAPTGSVLYRPSTDPADQTYADLRISDIGWCQYSHMLRRAIETSNSSVDIPTVTYEATEDLGYDLFDTLVLTWPNPHQILDVWVYREQASGLVLCGEFVGTGDNITIHDPEVMGDLIVSASALQDGYAISYSQFDSVKIAGRIGLNVTLVGAAWNASVQFVIASPTGIVRLNATLVGNHTIPLTLLTPRDVRIGDEVNVSADSGDMNGTASLVVTGTTLNVTIQLTGKPPKPASDWLLTLSMVLLAAALILVFFILLRREKRMNGR